MGSSFQTPIHVCPAPLAPSAPCSQSWKAQRASPPPSTGPAPSAAQADGAPSSGQSASQPGPVLSCGSWANTGCLFSRGCCLGSTSPPPGEQREEGGGKRWLHPATAGHRQAIPPCSWRLSKAEVGSEKSPSKQPPPAVAGRAQLQGWKLTGAAPQRPPTAPPGARAERQAGVPAPSRPAEPQTSRMNLAPPKPHRPRRGRPAAGSPLGKRFILSGLDSKPHNPPGMALPLGSWAHPTGKPRAAGGHSCRAPQGPPGPVTSCRAPPSSGPCLPWPPA